jgi:gliding motility-associated-like protein
VPVLTLTASSSLSPLSYTWNGPGIQSSVNSQTVAINATGVYTVFLRSCVGGTSIATYSVYNAPTVLQPTITPIGALTCLTPTMALSASPSGTPHLYSWSGPGVVSPNSPVTTITAPGNYSLVVSNTVTGCVGTSTINISSSIAPLAITINASSLIKCSQGPAVTITANGATSYAWLPALTTTPSTGPSVSAAPASNTTYTVIGSTGVCSGTAAIAINVVATPTITNTGGSPTVCANTGATISAGGASAYTWFPGAIAGGTVVVIPASSTVYTVVGSVSSCTASATVNVSALPAPTIVPTASPSTVCQGASTTLFATGGVSYTWQPGNLSGNSQVITPTATTVYSVTGTNSIGCSSASTVSVTVVPNPTLSVSPPSPSVCAGNYIALTGSGAATYTWNPGNLNAQTISVNPAAGSIYTLSGSSGGCTSSQTVAVSVVPNPTIFAVNFNPTICAGGVANLGTGGATSYTWLPGAMTTSGVAVSPSVTTVYTVTGMTGGCTTSKTLQVVVIPGPAISAAASPTAICQGLTATLTAANAQSYTWQPGNLTGATQIVSPSGTTIYTVSGKNASGCASSSTILLTVNQYPNLIASPFPSTVCSGSSVTLAVSGASSYTWSPTGATGPSVTVGPTSTSIYTVTGMTNSCASSSTLMLTVMANPTVTASASNSNICLGATTTLTASGANSYTWLPGNITGSVIVVSPTTPFLYNVVGAVGSCTAVGFQVVLVSSLPVLTVTPVSTSVCPGTSATLTASGGQSYTWQPGNLTGAQIVTTASVNTIYTVTGTNLSGCVSAATMQVYVLPLPVLNVSPATPSVCQGGQILISATGATFYNWMPGNLSGSTVLVAPASSLVYTVTGQQAGCSGTKTVAVTVVPAPPILAIASSTSICAGLTTTLYAGGTVTYTWMPGNLSGSQVTVSPGSTTIYTVTGTAGCTNSTTVTVVVTPAPLLSPAASPAFLCYGNTTTLSASNALTYTWQPGNHNGQTFVVTPAASTAYTVSGTNGNGCTGTATIPIIVNPNPTITVSAGASSVCAGGSVTISAFGGVSYTWLPMSSILSAGGSSAVAAPSVTTVYTVTGSNGSGCKTAATFTVFVSTPPVLAISGNSNICSGNSTTLTASGAASYTWLPSGSLFANIIVSPQTASIYSVMGSNGFGCTAIRAVTVNVAVSPTLSVSGSSSVLCGGGAATLTAGGATTYTWLPSASPFPSIIVSPAVSTTYTVLGTIGSCTASAVYNLTVGNYPIVSVFASSSAVCSGSSLHLTAAGALTYQWEPGNLSGVSVTVTPVLNTNYTVTGTNAQGCSATATMGVGVSQVPVITSNVSSTVLCSGATATLASTGAITYTWLPGTLVGPSVTVAPLVSASYTVTGTDSNGCQGTSTVGVIVNPVPVLNLFSSDSVICAGSTATITATGAATYIWGTGATGNQLVVAPLTNSVYAVTGEMQGCSSTATLQVTVIDCSNKSFGVTNAAGEPILYNGNGYKIGFTVTVVNSSPVNLTNVKLNDDLATTFLNPCTFSFISPPVVRSAGSGLSIDQGFDGSARNSLTSPGTSTLYANRRDTIVFSLLVEPNGFAGTVKNSVVGFADLKANLTLSDSSNNGFAWDPDKDGDPTNNNDITLIDLQAIDLFIPNGFSPNADGRFDELVIKGLNGRPVKFTVFNRWGNVVYETRDSQVIWNGYPNKGLVIGNNKLPASTYYYILQFEDGKKEARTGFVVIEY